MQGEVKQATVRNLLGLAWPMIVARSTQSVIGFCDALMIAPLGEDALAAVTTGAMNTYFILLLPMGLVFIGQSFAAQLHGRKQLQVAVRYAWYGLILSAATAVFALSAIPAIGPTLKLLGYEANVHSLMTEYLQIRMASIGAAIGVEAIGNWYGGIGNTKLQMRAGLVGMVINVALNWVLIGGNLGAPALGTAGAAWASVIASWMAFGVVAVAFLRRSGLGGVSIQPHGLKVRELRRMVRFGLPHGMNWFLEFAAFALFINVLVAQLGTTVLAAMMVVLTINSVSFMPAFGITSAGAILSGQAIGRKALDEVTSVVWRTLGVALVWQTTVGVTYLLIPELLMTGFAPAGEAGPELIRIGAVLLALSAAWQMFDSVAMTMGETLRSAGDTSWTLWARLALAWFVFLPGAYVVVAQADGGYVGAMLCIIGYLGLLAVVLAWRFKGGAWRSIALVESDDEVILAVAD